MRSDYNCFLNNFILPRTQNIKNTFDNQLLCLCFMIIRIKNKVFLLGLSHTGPTWITLLYIRREG